MKPLQTQAHYNEWLNAEQMHEASKKWLSELKFIRDEHLFFEDLITTFTTQLIAFEKFAVNIEIIDILNKSQKRNNSIIETIKVHENELLVMVDGVDQIEKEKLYRKEHKDLFIIITDFLEEYKSIKKQIFSIIKNIKKKEKQRHLLDKK